MRKILWIAAATLLVLAGLLLLATLYVSRPAFDETLGEQWPESGTLLPTDEALSFARVATERGRRLLLVRSLTRDSVTGVDLTAQSAAGYDEPLTAFKELGYSALAALAGDAESAETFPATALTLPLTVTGPQIAAGTNFRAHAREAMLDGEPFLFPKLSSPTAWNAPVPGAPRLDYEAELCAVTLTPFTGAGTGAGTAGLGFLLCNDFTDRWTLVRDIDLDAPMGSTGFAAGKGRPGYLPLGPLLVIPRDPDRFVRQVQLELYVNGRLRQRAPADLMVWKPQDILREALAGCAEPYQTPAGPSTLTPCDAVPAGSLILTGTPAGVVFRPVNLWYGPAYLRPGDDVITAGTHLGWLVNRIVED